MDNDMKQPQATDFTKVDDNLSPPGSTGLGGRGQLEYSVSVRLDSGWKVVAKGFTQRHAEEAELAINQVMIEYRTKRNDWNNQH